MHSKSEYRRLSQVAPEKLVEELVKRDAEIERLKANIEVFQKREGFTNKCAHCPYDEHRGP